MTSKTAQANLISQNIKRLRDNKGWNQSKLAQEAGISAAALSKIEKGESRIPTMVVLRKLASALNVQLHEITGEEPEMKSVANERNRNFYRRWDILEGLSDEDQEILKGMAERLRTITKK